MARPIVGMLKIKCPNCGNQKCTMIMYKDYERFKCTKCKYIFIFDYKTKEYREDL